MTCKDYDALFVALIFSFFCKGRKECSLVKECWYWVILSLFFSLFSIYTLFFIPVLLHKPFVLLLLVFAPSLSFSLPIWRVFLCGTYHLVAVLVSCSLSSLTLSHGNEWLKKKHLSPQLEEETHKKHILQDLTLYSEVLPHPVNTLRINTWHN